MGGLNETLDNRRRGERCGGLTLQRLHGFQFI